MALNYSNLFARLGCLIARIDSYLSIATTTLPADLTTIETLFGTFQGPLTGMPNTYAGYQNNIVSWRQGLARYCDALLLDYTTVLSQLNLPAGSSIQQTLTALLTQMLLDAQTVKASVVTIGTIASTGTNAGNGLVLATAVLDGFSAPVSGMPANLNYNSLLSQLAVPAETQILTCSNDSQQGGLTEGAETFALAGAPQQQDLTYLSEGSGNGPGITCANQNPTIQNRDFETWTGSVPSGWTLTTGGAGVTKETSTVFRGSTALKFAGNASLVLAMKQSINNPSSTLRSKRRWVCGIAVKFSSVPTVGTFSLKFTGTGYSAAAVTNTVQTVTVAGASGGTYTLTWPQYGQTTAAINGSDVASAVQAKLRALVGLESVVVTQTGSTPNFTNTITFYGFPGDAPLLTVGTNSLTGGGTATPAVSVHGVEGEQVNLPPASLPTAWAIRWFWINTPAILPSDFALNIGVTGPLDNAVNMFVDSLLLCPVSYFGGIGLNVVAGSSRWLKNDRLTVAVANNQGGKFQDFARKHWNVQLPSNAVGGETISDAAVV